MITKFYGICRKNSIVIGYQIPFNGISTLVGYLTPFFVVVYMM